MRQTDQLRTLGYVSCGFGALRRDAAALLSAGWKIARGTRPEAHVLFLGANHIEAVVAFERNLSADGDAALTSRARTVAHVDATRRERVRRRRGPAATPRSGAGRRGARGGHAAARN